MQIVSKRPRATKITAAMEAVISAHLQSHPESSCPVLVRVLHDVFAVTVSRQLVHVVVKKLGYTRKRTRKRGVSTKSVDKRPRFLECFRLARQRNLPIVAIDESGFDQRCKPVYGYALRGQPAIVKWRPCSDRRRLSLLMAIDSEGRCEWFLNEHAVKGDVFAAFVQSLPHPAGSCLLLDNASIHKTAALRSAASNKGYTLLFTPPYSPEFNPIELVFGVMKNEFYALRYRQEFNNDLHAAVVKCIQRKAIASTIRNCFHHVDELVMTEMAAPDADARSSSIADRVYKGQ